jgi:hypothetical protein
MYYYTVKLVLKGVILSEAKDLVLAKPESSCGKTRFFAFGSE